MWYRCLGEESFGEMLRWFEGQSQMKLLVRLGTQGQPNDSQCADEELIVVIDDKRGFRLSSKSTLKIHVWSR